MSGTPQADPTHSDFYGFVLIITACGVLLIWRHCGGPLSNVGLVASAAFLGLLTAIVLRPMPPDSEPPPRP